MSAALDKSWIVGLPRLLRWVRHPTMIEERAVVVAVREIEPVAVRTLGAPPVDSCGTTIDRKGVLCKVEQRGQVLCLPFLGEREVGIRLGKVPFVLVWLERIGGLGDDDAQLWPHLLDFGEAPALRR